ncbi:hypothetical protein NMA510612_2327 [Neisseria meningitidis]|uniref:Uncharacterized protein n=1 Tax=Neisseria meningitidis TaxID=487 RepID=X5FBF1_NEIME|nr:hypothetical protein NMA510612_2327 [Neisseria meningitidis]
MCGVNCRTMPSEKPFRRHGCFLFQSAIYLSENYGAQTVSPLK